VLLIRIGKLVGLVAAGSAAVGLAPTAALAALTPPADPIAPFAACPNLGYQVQSQDGITSTYGYFDLNTSTFVPIRQLPTAVNGSGYSRSQGVFWGMLTNFANNHLARWDSKGNLVDVGTLDGVPAGQVIRTNVGTVDAADHLLIQTRDPAADRPGLVGPINQLITVDVDPDRPTFGEIVNSVPLSRATPGMDFLRIGDWDFNPGDGMLYSLEMVGDTKRELVKIDPSTGQVTDVADLTSKLPDSQNYGAVYVEDLSGTIYVSANDVGDKLAHKQPGAYNQTFAIYQAYANPQVVAYTPGAPLLINDGADCLVATDFGDAPDSYKTLTPSGGPGHIFTEVNHPGQKLRIGQLIDPDLDGIPTTGADGDDKNLPVNDEDDGVSPDTTIFRDAPALSVPITNTTGAKATIAGWLDLDGSGTFEDSERAMVILEPGQTSAQLTWPTLENGRAESLTETFLRLRLYPGEVADPQPTGAEFVDGGEIEDHRIVFGLPDTGDDVKPILGLGLGLLVAGMVVTGVSGVGRRRPTPSGPASRRPSPRPARA
jgi:GEVED domain